MSVDSRHPLYTKYATAWTTCRDSDEGSLAIKPGKTKYVPKPDGMDQPSYDRRIEYGMWDGRFERAVQILTGMITRKEPEVIIPDALAAHKVNLDDITNSGVPLTTFAAKAAREGFLTGRTGILVSRSASTERTPENQAYFTMYRAEQIVNWQTQRVDGRDLLMWVVLHESFTEPDKDEFDLKPVEQYRVCRLVPAEDRSQSRTGYVYQVQVWRKNDKSEWITSETYNPNREEVPLDFIPFTFVNSGDLLPEPTKPPLHSAAEMNVALFRNSVVYETALRFIPPTPVLKMCKADTFVVGNPEKGITIEDPEGEASYMTYDGTGMSEIRLAMKDKKDDIAVQVSRALETSRTDTEAWQTQAMRRSGEVSVVQSVAINLSLGLTLCLRWKMWWDGVPREELAEVSVRMNTALSEVSIEGPKLTALVSAYIQDAMSFASFYHILTKAGMTREGVDAEAELEEIVNSANAALADRDKDRETSEDEDREIEDKLDELEEEVKA